MNDRPPVKRSATVTGLFYGWYVVAATFLVLFAGFGAIYSFGAFFLALSAEFDAGRAAVSGVFSAAVFMLFATGAVSGMIADRTGPKIVMAAGVVAIVAGLLGASVSRQLWQVTTCFTLGVGLGVGFVYVPSVSAVQHWFEQRRGLASGLAVTGIGVGTLVMPIIAGVLLESMIWRQVFVIMAALVAVIGIVSVLVIEADPAVRGLAPDGGELGSDRPAAEVRNINLAPMLRSRPFTQFYAAQAILAVPIFIPFVHLVPFAEDIGIARAQAVGVLGLIGFGSTAGRFIIGGLADRLGRRRSLILLLGGIASSYFVWLTADGIVALACFALWFGMCYGGYVALSPALLADYFAGPRLSSVIGLQYTAGAIGSLLGPILAGYLFDLSGAYTSALVIGSVCAVAAFALVLAMPEPIQPRWSRSPRRGGS